MIGTYFYQYAVSAYPVLRLERFNMPVEVVAEKGNRYQVKYLAFHMNGARPGTLHWVQKRKVAVKPPPVNPENIKLPYKD